MPLIYPIMRPNNNTAAKANHGGTPFDINDIRATLDAPIKNGIDKSRPPNNATKVCPTVARPKNAANTNIAFMFKSERKPLMVSEPNINNAIKTQIPIKTLFCAVIYRPTTPINMIKPRNIKKDTKVRPEKKPSAMNETKIKISIKKKAF